MIAVDSSILAYASNRFAPQHVRAARVLEGLANGDIPWALPWTVVHEFLHLVTHPHAVARPLRPADAWGFVARSCRRTWRAGSRAPRCGPGR